MKRLASTVLSLSLLVPAPVHANQAGGAAPSAAPGQDSQTMKITRRGTQPSQEGPAESFTGSVRVTPLFEAKDSSRASGASVSFEPGARSAWHTHPRGQVLERALENGVTREELSELITHLAFYAGWPAANTAVLIARDFFKRREK